MSCYILAFEIDPVPKGRPRKDPRKGHMYTPKATRDYEKTVRQLVSVLYNGPLHKKEVPLEISLTFNLRKPKSVKRSYPSVKPDLDNLAKAVYDAMEGVVFEGDGQIVDSNLSKRYSEKGSVVVTIRTKVSL